MLHRGGDAVPDRFYNFSKTRTGRTVRSMFIVLCVFLVALTCVALLGLGYFITKYREPIRLASHKISAWAQQPLASDQSKDIEIASLKAQLASLTTEAKQYAE